LPAAVAAAAAEKLDERVEKWSVYLSDLKKKRRRTETIIDNKQE